MVWGLGAWPIAEYWPSPSVTAADRLVWAVVIGTARGLRGLRTVHHHAGGARLAETSGGANLGRVAI